MVRAMTLLNMKGLVTFGYPFPKFHIDFASFNLRGISYDYKGLLLCHNDLEGFERTVHLKVNGTNDAFAMAFEPHFNPSSIYRNTTEIKFEGIHTIPSLKSLSADNLEAFDSYMTSMLQSLGNKDVIFRDETARL